MLERRGLMGSVGAETRVMREGLLQMSRADKSVAGPSVMVAATERERRRDGCRLHRGGRLGRPGLSGTGKRVGGRSRRDSKLLVWTDGRTVAPLAAQSWGLERFGGGKLTGLGFAQGEGEETSGGPSEKGVQEERTNGQPSRAAFRSLFSPWLCGPDR